MTASPDPFPQLATPGERLGWIFHDRHAYLRGYPEPPPEPPGVPDELVERLQQAEEGIGKRIAVALGVGVLIAGMVGCCAAFGLAGDNDTVVNILALGAIGLGFVAAVLISLEPNQARKRIEETRQNLQAEYAEAYVAWNNERFEHDEEQRRRVDAMDEWGAAAPPPGTRRVDIIGGTTYGWEAVLTVFGGSLLATRGRMILVDFTGEALCGELMRLATGTGRSVRELRLPSQLTEFDLVGGLTPDELVDCLVEAMHGDAQGANRAERSQDTMLLREVSAILDPRITMARLLAALRVLTDRPAQRALTAEESERLVDLHPDENRRQMHPHLRRIEAFLHPLETMGRDATDPGRADLTCLIADRDQGNAETELLQDLLVQWLDRQVRREAGSIGSLVLLGADEISHRAIERLGTLCERRGVRLVLFFSHLRAESLQTIGGGEVALMRLGNHTEAQQAAEFIGKGHTFVLTQLTRTLGGSETHSLADTYGEADTHGRHSGGGGHSSHTRNWSRTRSVANGTNWSDASTVQRVYEYAVEPTVLQDLPDHAMVLVKREGNGVVIQAVEVDPAIVTLPRVSMSPIEPEPLP